MTASRRVRSSEARVKRLDLRRDGVVLALLAVSVVLLVSALTGAYRVFGYALVTFLGVLLGIGFVRPDRPITWVPPAVATAVLCAAFTGIFVYEAALVTAPADTLLGFQPGTAFLVYGVWIPAYFTFGVSFALVFQHLASGSRRGGLR